MDTVDDIGKILEGEVDLPARVTNQMIMMAMKYERNERKEILKAVEKNEKRLESLEKSDKVLKIFGAGITAVLTWLGIKVA